jgi:hypothetical protein
MNNLIFISDELPSNDNDIKNSHDKKTFIDYICKTNSSIESHTFYTQLNVLMTIPEGKYFVFYESSNFYNSMLKLTTDSNYKKIVDDMRNDLCKIILFTPEIMEGDYRPNSSLFNITDILNNNNISSKNVKYIIFETIINKEKKAFELKGEYITHNRCANNIYSAHNHMTDKTFFHILDNSRNYYRKYKYITFNNAVKDHRFELLKYLNRENLLKFGLTSWFTGEDSGLTSSIFDVYDNMDKFTDEEKTMFDVYDSKYKFTDEEKKLIGNKGDLKVLGLQDYLNIVPHFDCYFNIVTESAWGPGYDNTNPQKIMITEKVWKPIISFQPFILISTKNNLNKLREWGFKTFDGFIDESYDELNTYEERKKIIYSEIKRLCSKSIEELDDWYWSMEDILKYNYNYFFNTFIIDEHKKLEDFLKW